MTSWLTMRSIGYRRCRGGKAPNRREHIPNRDKPHHAPRTVAKGFTQ